MSCKGRIGASVALVAALVSGSCGGSVESALFVQPGGDAGPDGDIGAVNDAGARDGGIVSSHDAAAVDAAAHAPVDAAPEAAGYDAGSIACGNLSCDGTTQFCRTAGGGPPPPPDSGPIVSYACAAIPAACAPTPTCDCLKANGGCDPYAAFFCRAVGGGLQVDCAYP
jgi:hypothetical protein